MTSPKNTSGKKHQNKVNTNKKKSREFNLGSLSFQSQSQAALFLLINSEISQSDIARICNVSQPCVCQLAQTLKPKKRKAVAK